MCYRVVHSSRAVLPRRALGQSRTGLLRRAARAVELSWNLQVRSGEPDPLGADVVHVREDRRNGADLARRLGSPGDRIKVFDNDLVHAIVGGEDPDCGLAELSMNIGLTRAHGSYSLTHDTSGVPSCRIFITSVRRQEWRRGTQKCVRHVAQ